MVFATLQLSYILPHGSIVVLLIYCSNKISSEILTVKNHYEKKLHIKAKHLS